MKIEEIKKYTHMHKIQEFLDTDKGSVQIHKLNGDLCFVVSCDILKTYIEEQERKNDYLNKRILELEEKLDEFKYSYEFNKNSDNYLKQI